MGERSVPMTSASGCSSAKSMAHMPVPVPMSRTVVELLGIYAMFDGQSCLPLFTSSGNGARNNLLSNVLRNR